MKLVPELYCSEAPRRVVSNAELGVAAILGRSNWFGFSFPCTSGYFTLASGGTWFSPGVMHDDANS